MRQEGENEGSHTLIHATSFLSSSVGIKQRGEEEEERGRGGKKEEKRRRGRVGE